MVKTKEIKIGDQIATVINTGPKTIYLENKPVEANSFIVVTKDKRSNRVHIEIDFIGNDTIIIWQPLEESKGEEKKGLVFKLKKEVSPETLFSELEKFAKKINLRESWLLEEAGTPLSSLLTKVKHILSKLSLGAIVQGIFFLIGVVSYILYFIRVKEIKSAEKEAETIERKIDEALFKNANYSALDEFSALIAAINSLLDKDSINGVLVYGPPGTGKTYTVRYVLYKRNVNTTYVKGGAVTLVDFLKILWKYRKGYVIVLDDFDSVLKDDDFINVMKSATDSYRERVISVPKAGSVAAGQDLEMAEIPDKFVFRSKIVLITNKDRKEIPTPLISRMYSIRVDFPNDQMFRVISKSLKTIKPSMPLETKMKVLTELKRLVDNCEKDHIRIDFRRFTMALDMYTIYGDEWQKYMYDILCK